MPLIGFEVVAISKSALAWVKMALTQAWELFQTLFLKGNRDSEPALASRQQDEQKGIGWSSLSGRLTMLVEFCQSTRTNSCDYNLSLSEPTIYSPQCL